MDAVESGRALRPYQVRAVRRVGEEWTKHRSVCLVAPTGSGKTTMGAALVQSVGGRAVWVAHRRELVSQAAERLRGDGLVVGCHCPGMPRDDAAPVQVGTIQTLLARGHRPPADLVVLDEAHHHAKGAEYWHSFQEAYQDARILGLTATPERADGSPLGDVFGGLVEAASYSELMAGGYLVDCHVFRGPDDATPDGWCTDPVSAYKAAGEDGQGFAFFDRVAVADEWAGNLSAAGIPTEALSQETSAALRDGLWSRMRSGDLRLLSNVYVLTEGVDYPPAQVCLLARACSHPSIYLQMVGRVLRPSPGKPYAILLDLMGASARFGVPTTDRVYSLEGKAIEQVERAVTKDCPECGHTCAGRAAACPCCGYEFPVAPPKEIRIYSEQLRRVYAGAETSEPAKLAELDRLLRLARSRGWSLGWVALQYKKLFASEPDLSRLPEAEKAGEYDRLLSIAGEKGYKEGWAMYRYKALFGRWPARKRWVS